MSFATALWDGFEKIEARLETQFTVCYDYAGFWKKRAKYEKNYGEDLADLTKTPPGNSKAPAVMKVEKTMREALLSVSVTANKTALKHIEAAKKLNDDILKPFEAFLKTAESDKKKLCNDGEKKVKMLKEAISTATKAKESYEKLCKEADGYREAHHKAQQELNGAPDNKKFVSAAAKAEQNLKKAEDKANVADTAYQTAVKAVNDLQSKIYNDEFPRLLSELQHLFEETFKQLHKFLTLCIEVQNLFPQEDTAAVELLTARISHEINMEADIHDFIEASKSDKLSPIPIKYVAYGKAATEDDQVPALAPASTTTPTTTVPSVIASAVAAAATVDGEEEEEEEKKEEQPKPAEEEKPVVLEDPKPAAAEQPAIDRPDLSALLAPAPSTDSLF